MRTLGQTPLNELEETALFELLGDAWCAIFKPLPGGPDYFIPSVEIGMRECDTLRLQLSEGSVRPCEHGTAATVAEAVRTSSSWLMPMAVVVALTAKLGLESRRSEFVNCPHRSKR